MVVGAGRAALHLVARLPASILAVCSHSPLPYWSCHALPFPCLLARVASPGGVHFAPIARLNNITCPTNLVLPCLIMTQRIPGLGPDVCETAGDAWTPAARGWLTLPVQSIQHAAKPQRAHHCSLMCKMRVRRPRRLAGLPCKCRASTTRKTFCLAGFSIRGRRRGWWTLAGPGWRPGASGLSAAAQATCVRRLRSACMSRPARSPTTAAGLGASRCLAAKLQCVGCLPPALTGHAVHACCARSVLQVPQPACQQMTRGERHFHSSPCLGLCIPFYAPIAAERYSGSTPKPLFCTEASTLPSCRALQTATAITGASTSPEINRNQP